MSGGCGFAELAGTFDRALAVRGVDAGTRRASAFTQTLAAFPPRSPADFYWLARVSMLPSIADLAAFEAAFVDVWNVQFDAERLAALVHAGAPAPSAPANRRGLKREAPPAPSDECSGAHEQDETPLFVAMAAPEERLGRTDFAEMDDTERLLALRAIERMRVAIELRRSRRRRLAARGDRLDMRATLRAAARTSGELVRRRRSARRERPRPLVFLCDVSGSMGPYARALLQYARVAAVARPHVRAFAFATALTDLGPALRHASFASLMRKLAELVRDYGGGTRIGAALRAFNEGYAQHGAARGGTVVILSDGWERDDPELVREQMQRLRRLCRRVVWVNPQKKHPAFEPLARGMAAALPYIDALVAGHNLRTLDAVADAILGVEA
ncbi:MAG: vWA domain-containing protein [Vulcanimicrobiaceae bacterium]